MIVQQHDAVHSLTPAQCEQLHPRLEKGARERRLQQIDRRIAGGHGGLTLAFTSDRYELHGRDPITREDGCLARYEAHADVGLVDMHASAHEDLTFLRELLAEAFSKIRDLQQQISRTAAHAEGASASPRPSQCEVSCAGQCAALHGREEKAHPDYSAEAAMKCSDSAFVAYLVAEHGLEQDAPPEFVAGALRNALGIASRKDLNTDPAAATRWRDLKADFDAWRMHGPHG
ncbi:hypothetical protein [Pararhizobium haloflavum]|uniref:hypothetical protein n=1 Tax=Pararhizobium haloflavum TaxID=2037914 RepID=UPI00130003C6|nr:hypothetical protein [Pararhizobium haloflavum]